MLLAVPVSNAFAISYQIIPLSHHAPIDKFVYTSTRSQDVIFYLIDARGGSISHPSWQVVAQNATDNSLLGFAEISEAGSFTHLFGNMIAVQASGTPQFFIFDGRTLFDYEWNGTQIKQVSNVQVCSDTNYTIGSHHIQAPSHFTTANMTIDNIVSGVCVNDKSLWVVNGNSMTTMSSININANCQWLVDGYINLGLLADQTITALCNNGGTLTSQTGPQEYVVYTYETNGPTILNGGHIVSQILLRSTTLSATPTYSLVQNLDYSHFSFVDVSNLFSAKPLTMQDTCVSGDCPTVFNVWQNFESGSSSAFFKNGIVVNYDKTLKGIRLYNAGNSTQIASRTCGTDCFPVSFAGQPWLSMQDINPNYVYEGTFDTITRWNTTDETALIYNASSGSNNPGQSGNNCTSTPTYNTTLIYNVAGSNDAGLSWNNTDHYLAGEHFTVSSRYLNQPIGIVTYHVPLVNIFGSIPSGSTVTFGAFSTTNATILRTFATLDLSNSSMFTPGSTNVFNITLPRTHPYIIAANSVIGYRANFYQNPNFTLSWQDTVSDATDGPDSALGLTILNGSNADTPTSDYGMQMYSVKQNSCNAPPTNPTTPGSVFCANPANANILQCRVAGNTTTLNVAPGIQNLISSTGIFNLCSGVFKTNGMGYLVTLILVIIGVGLLWVASNKRGRDIPTFLWVIFAIGIFGFSTAIGCIDPTILIVTIIAIIALGVASTTELLQGATRRLIARE